MSGRDLRKQGGSFMSQGDRAQMQEFANEAGGRFKSTVMQERAQDGQVPMQAKRSMTMASEDRLRELAERAALGDKAAEAELAQLAREDANASVQQDIDSMTGSLFSEGDFAAPKEESGHHRHEDTGAQAPLNPEDFREKQEDGTVVCTMCNSVVERNYGVEISEEQITDYILGGRVEVRFKVGRVELVLQTLTDLEFKLVDERMAASLQMGEFGDDESMRNFRSLLLMCFALRELMGAKFPTITEAPMVKGVPVPVTVQDMKNAMEERLQTHMTRGHSVNVIISQRYARLESAVAMWLEDEDRIKN